MELLKRKLRAASDGRCPTVFVLKFCISHNQSLSGKVRGPKARRSRTPLPRNVLLLRHSFQMCHIQHMHSLFICHQYLVSARLVSIFPLRFEAAATFLHRRHSVSYTKIKLWQNITYEEDFMLVKIYTALNSEMGISTQFQNTLDQDKNCLLLTKWLHMMNKFNVYSYARTNMNSI